MTVSPRGVRSRLRNVPTLPAYRRHRRKHSRDTLFVATDNRDDIARADGHRASRPDDPPTRDHPLALSRRKKVHLVFDRQDRCARRHQRHRRVAASDIDDRREHGSGDVAVMLREIIPKRQVDFDLTGSDTLKSRTDSSHQATNIVVITLSRPMP